MKVVLEVDGADVLQASRQSARHWHRREGSLNVQRNGNRGRLKNTVDGLAAELESTRTFARGALRRQIQCRRRLIWKVRHEGNAATQSVCIAFSSSKVELMDGVRVTKGRKKCSFWLGWCCSVDESVQK
jgi:hypothetical protein